MRWNRSAFLRHLDALIEEHLAGDRRRFDDWIGSPDLLDAWKAGTTSPSIRQILSICELFTCDVNWLVTGKTGPDAPPFAHALVFIPKVEARLSGGDGSFETSERIADQFLVPEAVARRFGTVENLCFFEVRGDSMSPTIPDGALALVALGPHANPPRAGSIWAVRDGETLKVKRVHLEPDGARLVSDNPEVGDILAPAATFDLLGPVLWSGREADWPQTA